MDPTQDRDSPEAVIRRYSDMVYRLAFARTGNRSDAEGPVPGGLSPVSHPRPRIHLGGAPKGLAAAGGGKLRQPLPHRPVAKAHRAPQRGPVRPRAGGEDLWEELRRLPERDRTVLHLYYYEDMTTEEIAQMLGRNPATVRSQLLRARAKLKKLLVEEG